MTSNAVTQAHESNDSYFSECLEHLKDICKSNRMLSFDQVVAAKSGTNFIPSVSDSIEILHCV